MGTEQRIFVVMNDKLGLAQPYEASSNEDALKQANEKLGWRTSDCRAVDSTEAPWVHNAIEMALALMGVKKRSAPDESGKPN